MSSLENANKTELESVSWDVLIANIGLPLVNEVLDARMSSLFIKLQELTSLTFTDSTLIIELKEKREEWQPAKDQYERTVLHLAALNGNTKLVRCLVLSGAHVNAKDGIHQTPLTLSLHKNHLNTAKFLLEIGANVSECFFKETASPLEVAKVKKMDILVTMIENRNMREMSQIFFHRSLNKFLKRVTYIPKLKPVKIWTLTHHHQPRPQTTLGF